MHIILGGTGHVGSAASAALLRLGEATTIVTREPNHAETSALSGASIAVADVHDADALREIFRTGRRAFLLNPPADVAGDTDVEERRTVASIVKAIHGSGLEKLVLESTYGAQPGQRCGDLNILFEFEEALRGQPIPAAINRAAYYFTNWDAQIDAVRENGILRSFFPADFLLPMVSPLDLGEAAARRLTEPVTAVGTYYVEGPERYSARDVADAFAEALDRPVQVEVVPRDQWEAAYRKLGFSEAAAHSYARMTAASLDGDFVSPSEAERGEISLREHVAHQVSERVGSRAREKVMG